jgi:formylglycine-generating enzyme required for sulfatase activity
MSSNWSASGPLLLLGLLIASGAIAAPPAVVTPCLACHDQAPNLQLGDPATSVPKLRRQHAEYIVIALREYKSGVRTDPVMRAVASSLSERDMHVVAAWFQAGAKPRPQPPADHPMPKVVREVCEPCHGRTGLASVPEMPIIGGQPEDYMLAALRKIKSGERHNPAMARIVAGLTGAQLAEGAAYYAPQPPMLQIATDFEQSANAAAQSVNSLPVKRARARRMSLARATAIEMVDIPAGQYMMGSPSMEGDSPGVPRHLVKVPAFRMGKYNVTFEQYDVFTKATGRPKADDAGFGRGKMPVFNVDWDDTQAYIQWLNQQTGRNYRLPSEAEWEYAARAGATTHYWWGDTPDFKLYNSYNDAGPDRWHGPSPVGSFPANPWGLYDVTGNVLQRVPDCKKPTYDGAPTDGSAWVFEPCLYRVMRGGSWYNFGGGARAATRSGVAEATRSTAIGFRLAE